MRVIRNYAFALALSLTVIYIYAPMRLEDLAKSRWLDGVSEDINTFLAARREASVSPIDPVAAANLDEDLDYRIAQHVDSAGGWRAGLAAQPDGPHARSARAELDKLVPRETPPAPAAALVSNAGPPDMALSEAAIPAPPSAPSEVAKPSSNELCRRDEDRLERLAGNPTSGEAMRLVNELRCEKLRPELFRLTEHFDYRDSGAVVAGGRHPSKVAEAEAASRRAADRRDRRWRAGERRRHANRWESPGLPPILLALFGEEPRTSTAFQRTRTHGGAGRGGWGGH